MGALPGGGVLTNGAARPIDEPRFGEWFDVEQYRQAPRRVVVRSVDRPLVVLGSTQRDSVIDRVRASDAGIAVARRRGGGGAVLVTPGAQVWADMWLPATDALWSPEPRRTAVQVGRWWAAALARAGIGAAVHDAPSVPTRWSDLVCFAGVGPGEVLASGRKVVGLAQWRCRQGALVFGCAYLRFDPRPLVACLAIDEAARASLAGALDGSVTDLSRLGAPTWGPDDLLAALPDGKWDVTRG